jgi:hypothetical protein
VTTPHEQSTQRSGLGSWSRFLLAGVVLAAIAVAILLVVYMGGGGGGY